MRIKTIFFGRMNIKSYISQTSYFHSLWKVCFMVIVSYFTNLKFMFLDTVRGLTMDSDNSEFCHQQKRNRCWAVSQGKISLCQLREKNLRWVWATVLTARKIGWNLDHKLQTAPPSCTNVPSTQEHKPQCLKQDQCHAVSKKKSSEILGVRV